MAPPISYRDITITYDGTTGKIEVEPDPAPIYWVTGPDSARWRVATHPGQALTFDIVFDEGRSPFRDLHSTGTPPDYEVIGTDNTRDKGSFKYSVIIRDAQGKAVKEVDPIIDNSDTPVPDP